MLVAPRWGETVPRLEYQRMCRCLQSGSSKMQSRSRFALLMCRRGLLNGMLGPSSHCATKSVAHSANLLWGVKERLQMKNTQEIFSCGSVAWLLLPCGLALALRSTPSSTEKKLPDPSGRWLARIARARGARARFCACNVGPGFINPRVLIWGCPLQK